jgi:hypothetical protein
MLNVSVMWRNCPAWVMINNWKLCSAEIVRRIGPRQWLCWMQQQLVWHRRWGEEEENNVVEYSQPGTSAGEVSNWMHCFPSIYWSPHQQRQHYFHCANFILHRHYIHLVVEQSNLYYWQCLDLWETGQSSSFPFLKWQCMTCRYCWL